VTVDRRSAEAAGPAVPVDDHYKWVALTNTTAGVLLATIDASILIIAMPDIFRGIKLDPLVPGNSVYLLWLILGYLVTGSVLVVSLGRLGDMYGRVRMYNLGFVIYTTASLFLTIDWLTGHEGALWLPHVPAQPVPHQGLHVRRHLAAAGAFVLLELLPINFCYPAFAGILLLNGLAMGAFSAPNRVGVMNSLPARHRGAGGGMNSTFMNSAQVFSLGIFFSLMIAGLAATLPRTLSSGLIAQGVAPGAAQQISHLPPISILFASFLGYNPIGHLLGAGALLHLPAAKAAVLTGRSFLPGLLTGPFRTGLHIAFAFSIGCCLIAAAASWSRGGRYVAAEHELTSKQPSD